MSIPRLPALLVAVALLGGCLAAPSGGAVPSTDRSPPPSTSTPTSAASPTPTATATPSPVSTADGCAEWVSFWGLGGPSTDEYWAPDRVRMGYTVTGNASVLFVAVQNGTVLGAAHVTTGDLNYGITADGDAVRLDESLSGTHTLRIRAFSDANANGVFDPGVDPPCASDGEVVTSGPETIDFDRFTADEDGTGTGTGTGTSG